MKRKREDIIIMTWKFCKRQQFYELTDVSDYLRLQGFDSDNIQFATSLAEESSYKLKNGKFSLKAESYVNLLNYEEVLIAKKSIRKASISIWIAIVALLITILLGFIKVEPIKTFDFSNKETETKQEK